MSNLAKISIVSVRLAWGMCDNLSLQILIGECFNMNLSECFSEPYFVVRANFQAMKLIKYTRPL